MRSADHQARRTEWWIRLVGPAIGVVLLSRLDTSEILAELAEVRGIPLSLSLFLITPFFLVKAWRWRLLLGAHGRRIRLLDAVELYTISAGAGSLTPGAIGDFWKAFSPAAGGRSIGLWTSTVDRLYDVGLLAVIGLLAASAWIENWAISVTILLGLAVALGIAWQLRGWLSSFVRSFLPVIPDKIMRQEGHEVKALAATVVAAAVAFWRFELLVAALGLHLSWRQGFIAFALTSGVAAMPLSVAGLGTRDVTLVAYLGSYGISPASAIALSSLCLTLYLWNAVAAAVIWLIHPPARPRSPSNEMNPL